MCQYDLSLYRISESPSCISDKTVPQYICVSPGLLLLYDLIAILEYEESNQFSRNSLNVYSK